MRNLLQPLPFSRPLSLFDWAANAPVAHTAWPPSLDIVSFLEPSPKNRQHWEVKRMTDLFTRLWKDGSGQGMVEYGLILTGIVIVVMVAIGPLGEVVAGFFEQVKDGITNP
jgi:Flp pilus assembly pilin Flp